jgi:hypothetical protein
MPVGPELPPNYSGKRKRSASDDAASESDSSTEASKRPRVIGPSLPPVPLNDEPAAASPEPAQDESDQDETSSEDDDIGPAPPNASNIAQKTAPVAAPSKPVAMTVQRDEWMTMAPSSGDWSSRVDPTQLKARKFNSGKGAKVPSAGAGAGALDAWHETPEQKQARLQRELMGIKDAATATTSNSKPQATETDAATAKRLKAYSAARGPSLYATHQGKFDKEEEDDPSKRAFDREKDIGGGLQLNGTQRREMMKKASDFGSRFSSAKYL